VTGAARAGDLLPRTAVLPLSRSDFARYADASGDHNPIHQDDAFARAAGHPGVFAHGMLSAGLIGSWLTQRFGPGSVRQLRVRFREIVRPGEELFTEGKVRKVSAGESGEELAEVEFRLRNAAGSAVVTGVATVVTGLGTKRPSPAR
jgi:acyl dehydratase